MKFLKSSLLILLVIILSISVIACGKDDNDENDEKLMKPTLTIEPIEDLFVGEGKRFKPFVGSSNGGVKITYKGNQSDNGKIGAKIEMWEDGQFVDTFGSFESYILENDRGDYEGELIISIDTQSNSEEEHTLLDVKLALIDDSGSSSFHTGIGSSYYLSGFTTITMKEKITVTAEKEVSVWGLQGSKTGVMSTIDLSEESIQKSEWVLVVKLFFD